VGLINQHRYAVRAYITARLGDALRAFG